MNRLESQSKRPWTQGAVPDDGVYIERAADNELWLAMRAGERCWMSSGHQVGKSSLRESLRRRLENSQYLVISIELSAVTGRSVDSWGTDLLGQVWDKTPRDRRALADLRLAYQGEGWTSLWQHVLTDIAERSNYAGTVLFIDEVQAIFETELDLGWFFDGLHRAHEIIQGQPDSSRFSICIMGSFLSNKQKRKVSGLRRYLKKSDEKKQNTDSLQIYLEQSKRIILQNFTRQELDGFRPQLAGVFPHLTRQELDGFRPQLAGVFPLPQISLILKDLYELTSGQPYLTHKLIALFIDELRHIPKESDAAIFENKIREIFSRIVDVKEGELQNDSTGIFAGLEHTKLRLIELAKQPNGIDHRDKLLRLYQRLLRDDAIAADITNPLQEELVILGLARWDEHRFVIQNELTRIVLNPSWLDILFVSQWFDKKFKAWANSVDAAKKKDPEIFLSSSELETAKNWINGDDLYNKYLVSDEEKLFIAESQEYHYLSSKRSIYAKIPLGLALITVAVLIFGHVWNYVVVHRALNETSGKLFESVTKKSEALNLIGNSNIPGIVSEKLIEQLRDDAEIEEKIITAHLEQRPLFDQYFLNDRYKKLTENQKALEQFVTAAKDMQKGIQNPFGSDTLRARTVLGVDPFQFFLGRADGSVEILTKPKDKPIPTAKCADKPAQIWGADLTGKALAMITGDGSACIIQTDAPDKPRRLAEKLPDASALALSADGNKLLLAAKDGVKLWSVASDKPALPTELKLPGRPLRGAVFSRSAKHVVLISDDEQQVIVEHVEGQGLRPTAPLPSGSFVSASPEYLVLSNKSGELKVCAIDSKHDCRDVSAQPLGVFKSYLKGLKLELDRHLYVGLRNDQVSLVVSRDSDGTAWVWDADSGEVILELTDMATQSQEQSGTQKRADRPKAEQAYLSPNGHEVMVRSSNDAVRFWQLRF